MEQNFKKKYFNILGAYAEQLSADEIDVKIQKITESLGSKHSEHDANVISLLTLACNLEDKLLFDKTIEGYFLNSTSNVDSFIRTFFRETRNTRNFLPQFVSKVIDIYPESFTTTVKILSEIHHNKFLHTLLFSNKDFNDKTFRDFLTHIAINVSHSAFPLKDLPLSLINKCFYIEKEESDALEVLKIDFSEINEVELVLYLMNKKSEGISFEQLLINLKDIDLTNESYTLAILFTYNKDPYDLLEVENEGLKKTAINLIS